MNAQVTDNYAGLRYAVFLFPLLLLLSITVFLYSENALNVHGYTSLQRDSFLRLNALLGKCSSLQHNLTQTGDALIILSLVSIFIYYAPTVWEALISASLISSILSVIMKNIFAIPRPAAVLDANTFIIVGSKLQGYNSLPSGHSITIFTTLTVLFFAFMPKKNQNRFIWTFFIVGTGLALAFTRVGVGAHYPLDILIGGTVGYLSALFGIFISRKYPIWSWVGEKRFYPVFLLLLPISVVVIIGKIMADPLPIYYITIATIFFSLYKLTDAYIKK